MKPTTSTHTAPLYTGDIPRDPLQFVWRVASKHWDWGSLAFLAVTIATFSSAGIAYFFGQIIDSATSGNVEGVFFWVFVFLVVSTIGFASWRASGFLGMNFLLRVERHGHLLLLEYLQSHSQAYFNNRFAGSLANKVSNGADGVEHLLESLLWNYYGITLNLIITSVYLAFVDVRFMFFFIGSAVFIFVTNYFLVQKLIPLVVVYSEKTSKFRGGIVDMLTNMSAVKSYANEIREHERLTALADDRLHANKQEWTYAEWILVFNNTIVVFIEAVLFIGSAYLWSVGLISAGTVVMMLTVLYRVQGDLVFIGNNIRSFIRQYGTIEEGLSEILVGQELTNIANAKRLEPRGGAIICDDVLFRYGSQTVFKDFSLTIPVGQRLGLVGESGAGKSTLVSLLLRQHNIQTGTIHIDDQNIAEVTQTSLREHIAVVPQEPLLFHRTIRENIAYGKPDATDEEIIAVAKKAQAHDFISVLPEGYHTMVGERGVKLSGGQKQRVAIARAMLKDAPILILDEATSALDSESEVLIQKALAELMQGKTVIAIAHRLSTLRKMDRIIVLEKGRIVEDGTHETLARSGGVYQRLWQHQAGGFLQE
ncbi:MAG: ABC transporter ATP-binding protein [Patescibacteria group bacterium]